MLQLKPQTERHVIDMAAEYGKSVDDFLEMILEDYRARIPNAETLAAIQELETGQGQLCTSVEQLMAHLDADD